MTSSNKTGRQRVLIFSLVAVALAVIATAGRLFSLLFFYDRIGYYQSGAILPMLSNIIFALSLLFSCVAAIFLIKPERKIDAPSKTAKYISLLPAIALIAHGASSALALSGEDTASINILTTILSVVAAIFFASITLSSRPSVITVLLGMGCIAWIALEWFISYRDFTVSMNSPDKLFFHLGCIGAALFIVAELRAIFGISKPRFYYFSLFTALLTLAVSSIPSLIGMACGLFASYSLAFEDLFLLSLLVYVSERLFSLAFAKKCEEVPAEINNDRGTEE